MAGKLEAAHRTPADLQVQLQQAQQQNQTLARILAERCEQAAAHVEHQQQLQDMWHQLLAMQAVPSSGTVQVSRLAARLCPKALQSGSACKFRFCHHVLNAVPSSGTVQVSHLTARFCLQVLPAASDLSIITCH